jgi:hypothetical protein
MFVLKIQLKTRRIQFKWLIYNDICRLNQDFRL